MSRRETISAIDALRIKTKREGEAWPGAVNFEELDPNGKMVKTILLLRKRCYTVKQIACMIHKRDRYVSWVLHHECATDIGINQVVHLRSIGFSIKAISKELGISDRIVAKVVRAHFRKNKVAK